jgi:hypothetical protein
MDDNPVENVGRLEMAECFLRHANWVAQIEPWLLDRYRVKYLCSVARTNARRIDDDAHRFNPLRHTRIRKLKGEDHSSELLK